MLVLIAQLALFSFAAAAAPPPGAPPLAPLPHGAPPPPGLSPARRATVTSATTLTAFGREFFVRDSGGARWDPGPCVFTPSPERIFADENGLHLTVAPTDGACGGWASTEAFLTQPLGYGTYVFRASGAFKDIDPQVTFGLLCAGRRRAHARGAPTRTHARAPRR
jgi:hypothetical protein